METGENVVLPEKGAGRQSKKVPKTTPPERPPGKTILIGPAETTVHLLSTLTPPVCSPHALDLGKLHYELKTMGKDIRSFQKGVMDTLIKLERTLSFLTEVVARLETRSHDMELQLKEEEDKGTARNKVLAFLLPREKELREKCAVLEEMFFKKDWLEEMVKKWPNE